MLEIRRSKDRGHANHGWLDTNHTFSFARYYDPAHMGFGPLRVINEDRVAPGAGFGRHPHHDMEIISYVLGGKLEHRDSMGHGSVIEPGEVQYMSAGTGVVHSEYNGSDDEALHFLQIWIQPSQHRTEPSYDQRSFPLAERENRFALLASGDGRDGSIAIKQDLDLWGTVVFEGAGVEHVLEPGRRAWIHVVKGSVMIGDEPLGAGDGASTSQPQSLRVQAKTDAEILIFDMAGA